MKRLSRFLLPLLMAVLLLGCAVAMAETGEWEFNEHFGGYTVMTEDWDDNGVRSPRKRRGNELL